MAGVEIKDEDVEGLKKAGIDPTKLVDALISSVIDGLTEVPKKGS